MSSNAISSQGATLKIGNGASVEVFTAIPELRNIDGPNLTSDRIDVTHLGSVGFRDFIAGLKEAGVITGEANWTQAGFATLLALYASAVVKNLQIVYADSPAVTYQGQGYVSALSKTAQANDAVKFNLTVQLTGDWTELP